MSEESLRRDNEEYAFARVKWTVCDDVCVSSTNVTETQSCLIPGFVAVYFIAEFYVCSGQKFRL